MGMKLSCGELSRDLCHIILTKTLCLRDRTPVRLLSGGGQGTSTHVEDSCSIRTRKHRVQEPEGGGNSKIPAGSGWGICRGIEAWGCSIAVVEACLLTLCLAVSITFVSLRLTAWVSRDLVGLTGLCMIPKINMCLLKPWGPAWIQHWGWPCSGSFSECVSVLQRAPWGRQDAGNSPSCVH